MDSEQFSKIYRFIREAYSLNFRSYLHPKQSFRGSEKTIKTLKNDLEKHFPGILTQRNEF